MEVGRRERSSWRPKQLAGLELRNASQSGERHVDDGLAELGREISRWS